MKDVGPKPKPRHGVSFGPFRLYAAERLLEKDGVAMRLGSRALDLLTILVERAGEVVGKAELLSRGWPTLTVDESSLRFQIAGLRRVLGHGAAGVRYVENVQGRGYCFVAPTALIGAPKERSNGASPVHGAIIALTALISAQSTAGAAMVQAKHEIESRNKAIVQAGFQAWRAGTASPYELLADDATWTIGGRSTAATTYASGHAFITDLFGPFGADRGVAAKPEIHEIYADGDAVIVLFTIAGAAYEGSCRRTCLWLLEMQSGKVASAWAFCESLPFNDIWVGLGREAPGAALRA